MKLDIRPANNYLEFYEKAKNGLAFRTFLNDDNLEENFKIHSGWEFDDSVLKYVDFYWKHTIKYLTSYLPEAVQCAYIFIVPANIKKFGTCGITTHNLTDNTDSVSYVAVPFGKAVTDDHLKQIACTICHEAVHQIVNKSKQRLKFIDIAKKQLSYKQFLNLEELITESIVRQPEVGLIHENHNRAYSEKFGTKNPGNMKLKKLIDTIIKLRGNKPFPELNEEFMQFLIDWYKQNILTQERG